MERMGECICVAVLDSGAPSGSGPSTTRCTCPDDREIGENAAWCVTVRRLQQVIHAPSFTCLHFPCGDEGAPSSMQHMQDVIRNQ